MKKLLILILALASVLLIFTSCDVINSFLPGGDSTDAGNGGADNGTAFDSSALKFHDRSFTYDGNTKGSTVSGTLPVGITVQYEGNDCVDVGTYTVTAKFFKNGEYIPGEDLTATVTITPATYNLYGVYFLDAETVYSGKVVTPALIGDLPDGLSVEFKHDEILNVGDYTVTAVFTGDSNHHPVDDITVTYTVTPAEYDMSGVSFSDRIVEYDGDFHSIIIEGTLPEGVSVEYVNSIQREVGEYIVEAVFTTTDPNYNAPAKMIATLTVMPEAMKPVELLYELRDDGSYEIIGWEGDNPHVIIPATYKGKRVKSIGSGAFDGNTNITYVSIPATVINIGNKAFNGCTSLVSFTCKGAIEVIGYKAFANTALTELVLPDSLVSIGQSALMGMPLEALTLPFIGGSRASSNAYLGYLFGATSYSGNAATVPATLKSVTLSDSATEIPAFAFYGVSSLKEVTVGNSVTFIGNSAFYGTSLASIYLPKSVVTIPADAYATNSPFYGLAADTVIMLEGTTSAGFGQYWNETGEGKKAITVYMKSYEYYLENKDAIKETDMTVATLDGITVDHSMIGGFDSSVLEYSATADINKGYPEIGVAPTSPTASVTIEQASSANGGIATITVVSADLSNTVVYKVKFTVTGTFNASGEVVGKDGTTGTVTFVLDDGDHATANFTVAMMNKYENLRFTYAILTNKLATLKTVYDSTLGKYVYVMDADGNYTYTVQQSEVDFWNELLRNYDVEVISHTHTHLFWGNNDDGGVQKYVDSSGNVKTSGNLPVGSASADILASLQIIEDLLGIRAITHTEPGIGVKTVDTTVSGTLYETYHTYYKEIINQALLDGTIVNYIGTTMGVTCLEYNRHCHPYMRVRCHLLQQRSPH